MLLWALLLSFTLISQGTGADWDDPICKEVVSVARGAPAQMTCNISNPFRHVFVCRCDPGLKCCRSLPAQAGCQPILAQASPGCSSGGGWRLCVRGHSAWMVTEEAQDSQAGEYRWTLVGKQKEQPCTNLTVFSEPPKPPSTAPWGTQYPRLAQDPLPAQDLHSAQDPPSGRLHVALILVPMLLCILAVGGLQFWRRNRGHPVHIQLP